MRLFVALDPPPALRERLESLLADLRREVPDVRWARGDSVHLTLKFLGEVGEAGLPPLAAALEGAAAASPGGFSVAVGGMGAFGDRGRPRVVWIGVEEPSGRLAALQAAVEEACAREGIERERRPFSPHLTLARPKAPSRALGWALASRAEVALGSFEAASLVLFRSHLAPAGASYESLREFRLGAGAEAP